MDKANATRNLLLENLPLVSSRNFAVETSTARVVEQAICSIAMPVNFF